MQNSESRNQRILDLANPEVVAYMTEKMAEVFSSGNVAYVKWDMNRIFSDYYSQYLPANRQKEVAHRYMMGLYRMLEELNRRFPEILFEGCASGGNRFDLGMLCFSPQVWCSDDTDPIERLMIQFGTSLCYPASSMGAHVSACDRTGYRTKGDVALWGTFGYELDPNKLSENDRAIVKEQVQEYHKYYDLIHRGDLYRLVCPWENAYHCAWSFVSPDQREALVTLVRMRKEENTLLHLKLQGLNPDAVYTVEQTGERYSGALLMYAGLEMSDCARNDGESCKLHLVAE